MVTTDAAPGFVSLAKGDKGLKVLLITLKIKDQLNKNFNAVVDRVCQDVEKEIRKIAPEGGKISESSLAKATITVNTLLRRKGKVSAFELHTARSQDTGENLLLDDEDIFKEQSKLRETKEASSIPDIKVGDTVTAISPQEKHKAREIYIVTGQKGDKVSTQRLLHPLSSIPLKFMSRSYDVSPKHLIRINRPHGLEQESVKPKEFKPTSPPKDQNRQVHVPWSPINQKYYEESSSEDDDDEINDDHESRRRFVMPLTPSPSNISNQPPANLIDNQEIESSNSDNNDQEHDIYEDSQDSFPPIEFNDDRDEINDLNLEEDGLGVTEVVNSLQDDDEYRDTPPVDNREDNVDEITVPEEEESRSAPEISLTDEDLECLDEFFDEVGAVGGNSEEGELVSSPSDQEAEEYVRVYSGTSS